ncbi:MAG: 3-oxoacyl-[acyl-carrier-protein] reductase [Hyphomicrobiales bacterium]|nr:SDR family oxidoreductase [Hyphomicrobiales bacterium]PCJ90714.1 MAG: 3-oxoacyl-[acyl-carrier-protein] reductase [Hyphomicrobiales bacterium]
MSKQASQRPGIAGQRVLITAGAAGIGLAIATRLINEGAKVLICDVDEGRLAEFATKFSDAHTFKADVSDTESVEALVAYAKAKLGGLDALINNAGIAGPTGGVEDIDPAEWKRCLDICLTGQFLCAHFAVPLIKASGGGSIVNMSSAAGKHGYAFRTPYSAAKFGVIGLTQSLAKELGPDNIRVNAILPGIVEGPRMEGVIRDRAEQVGVPYEEMEAEYLAKVSLRRMVTAQDVAGTVAFLLSADGTNISGQSLAVDGNVETL